MNHQEAIAASAARLRALAGADPPRLAVLLGSGWGGFEALLQAPRALAYAELPAFPQLGVGGHAGRMVWGRCGGRPVWLLCGRKHAYEDGNVAAMAGAVRTLAALGVQVLLQTSAVGSLDPALRPGGLLLVADHLNLPQRSPLVGLGAEAGDTRFVDMRHAYCPLLRAQALAAAPGLRPGTLAWVLGPQFETPAEIRMLQALGAHAVGMSVVPETLLARHAGMRVLALSLATNMGCGMEDATLSHGHTLATARAAGEQAAATLAAVVQAAVASLEPK